MNQADIVRYIASEFQTLNTPTGPVFVPGADVTRVVKRVLELSREKTVELVCSHCGASPDMDLPCPNENGHRWTRADGLPLFEVRDHPPAVNAPDVALFAVANTVTGTIDAGDIFSNPRVAARQAEIYNEAGDTGKH